MARPHIVIIGAGFGGLSAAHALACTAADVTRGGLTPAWLR